MVNSEDFLESSVTMQDSILDNLVISLDTREGSLNSYTGSGVTETFIQHLPEEVLQKVNFENFTKWALPTGQLVNVSMPFRGIFVSQSTGYKFMGLTPTSC